MNEVFTILTGQLYGIDQNTVNYERGVQLFEEIKRICCNEHIKENALSSSYR